MKTLVLNPASRFTKNVVRDVLYGCWCKGKRIGGGTVPPFNLLFVASLLQREGFDVQFLDAMAEQLPFEEQLKYAPDVDLVVCSTATMAFNEDAATLGEFKKRNPRIKTAIFGSHPTFMPQYALANEAVDFCVREEPDYIVLELVKCLSAGNGAWKNIQGLAYRDEDGTPVINEKAPYIEDLDELPMLDTSMLPKDVDYFNPLIKRMPYMTMVTSRGCPAKCTFCTAPYFYGPRVRFMSPTRVVDEIEMHLGNGYREIYFRDETFTVNNRRNLKIFDQIHERGLDFSWICNARVETVTKPLLEAMVRAGCHYIKFGVESGNQELLDRMKKGITLEQTRQAFQWCHEVGVDTHAHVMVGNPGETEETVQETIDFILEIDPTTVTFGLCSPYPGSELWDEVSEVYPEIGDGSATNMDTLHHTSLFNELYCSVSSEFLEEAVQRAYRAFYLRGSYFMKTLKRMGSLDEIKRYSLAGAQVVDFAIRGE